MSRFKLPTGTIVLIPYESTFAIAKVLYVSKYFKNVALFKVFSKRITDANEYTFRLSDVDDYELIYAGVDLIKKKKWEIINREPLSDFELLESKRIVAGDIWVEDKCLGSASDKELKEFPKMRVLNFKFVELKISKLPLI